MDFIYVSLGTWTAILYGPKRNQPYRLYSLPYYQKSANRPVPELQFRIPSGVGSAENGLCNLKDTQGKKKIMCQDIAQAEGEKVTE